jgi:hypothetical protein
MYKYNKYNIGDTVKHEENQSLEFVIVDILPGVPEKKGTYLYSCQVISNNPSHIPQGWATAEEVAEDINNPNRPLAERMFKYEENKLRLVKKESV